MRNIIFLTKLPCVWVDGGNQIRFCWLESSSKGEPTLSLSPKLSGVSSTRFRSEAPWSNQDTNMILLPSCRSNAGGDLNYSRIFHLTSGSFCRPTQSWVIWFFAAKNDILKSLCKSFNNCILIVTNNSKFWKSRLEREIQFYQEGWRKRPKKRVWFFTVFYVFT